MPNIKLRNSQFSKSKRNYKIDGMPNTELRNSQFLKPKRDYKIDDSLRKLYRRKNNLIIDKKDLEKLPLSLEYDEKIEEREKEIKILTNYIESLQKIKNNNKYKLGKL